jgi:tetratricopeptide (TPR) repeat protein
MSRISLCMIVRDEADMLPGFLEAVRGLWDELVVIDTGSADDTVALLEQAGGDVGHRPWDDDFAAARNAALDLATGDWILMLDADERPSAELSQQVRALVGDDTAGAATIRMRDLLPHGHHHESDLLRLWRNEPDTRFRHRIHEEANAAVAAALQRSGRRLVNLTGCCDHLGYVRDAAAARDKKKRDRDLLEACVAADPDDWYSWYKLLGMAQFWNDREFRSDVAHRVAARLDGPPPRRPEPATWTGEMLALAAQGVRISPADQLAWLDDHADLAPPSPAFFLHRGVMYEQSGQLDEAEADFRRCRELPAGALPMLTTVRPLLGLCRLAARRNDLRNAGDLALQALAHHPRDPEALLAAVSFAWLQGGATARDTFAAEHRALHGDSDELALVLGEHALEVGLWNEAAGFLSGAAGARPRGRAALRLAQAHLAGGDAAAARDLCRELMADLPEAGMGFLTCCLALGEQADFSVDLEQDEADAALKEWLALLWRSRQAGLMTAVVGSFPLVGAVFPWLPEFLTELTERLKQGR